ncbi:MAG: ABC transporter permease [Proteobacteria bacterium]|nr:ABC transporter permease [Pseudomonadota bacterium]
MLWETFLLAGREIRRNVMRSSLTMLGIVIGVAAVITMVTLGSGATEQVTSDISKLGSNLLQVRPGRDMHRPGGARDAGTPFELADSQAISREISGLKAVAPTAGTSIQVIAGNENVSTTVTGTTSEFLIARDWVLSAGRAFTASEVKSGKSVCILGSTVKKTLFDNQNPVGEMIRLQKIPFRIIGVLEEKGQTGFGMDQDDFVIIPLRAFQRRIAGNTEISTIFVSAKDGADTAKIQRDIERLMRDRRRILPGREDDFRVRDMKEIISTLTSTTKVLTALLGAVAGVSLLVGGIGIMNIMLVSVTERTREIGTRLAIGALERDVLTQFLVESVVLSSLGGVIGIILGLSAAYGLAGFLGVPFILNIGIVVIAFLFSGAVGIIFGYFPARKAAQLDPIEALRHE